jgi:hypothetical protein
VVYDGLQPEPPGYPPGVGRWVKVAAPDDVVAAVSDLRPLFTAEMPATGSFEGFLGPEPGRSPTGSHNRLHYLGLTGCSSGERWISV